MNDNTELITSIS